MHKEVWCCTTEGFACVGQDEIVFVLEVAPEEKYPPKDIFLTVNLLYQEASKGKRRWRCAAACTSKMGGNFVDTFFWDCAQVPRLRRCLSRRHV